MDDGPPLKRRAEGGEEPASKLPRLVPPPVDNVVVEVVNKEEDIVRYRAAVAGAPRVTAKRSGRPSDVDGREGDPDRRAQAAAAPEAGDEFEVRGIEAKYVERNGRVLYKVRWANGDATKEPLENLTGCLELVEAFEHRMKDPGTEPSLRRWYLSEQRQTLGYPPPEREHQGFNASDSDDDGAEYSDDAGGDDEEDEEMSAQDLPGDDGGSRVQGGDFASDAGRANLDSGAPPPAADRARSEQAADPGSGAYSKRLRVPQLKNLSEKKGSTGYGTDNSSSTRATKSRNKATAPRPSAVATGADPTHHTVCERCGMGPRKGGRKTQEERDSEDSGPLLNCLLCSNTYHLHCIGGYRSRDRRPNFTNENFVCQMCKAEPPICTYCGAGFEPGQLAFRCDRCAGLGHDECLVREFDDAFDIMFDEELGVEEGTVGWFHRKWRCIDCTRWSDEIGQILTYRDVSVGELTMREYLVKYKNHSHRHNDWVGEKWLSNLEDGKAKYKLFWKKVEEENGRASKWGLPKLPWPKTEDEAVPDVWKRIDRILDIVVAEEPEPRKKKKDASKIRIEKVLVKFQDQPWNESYMEKFPEENEEDYQEFKEALDAFQRRETLAVPKPANKNPGRFEEVTVQPKTLRGGDLKDYQMEGLNWLLFNHSQGRSGILADEMGLGKTIQTIAFLDYLLHNNGIAPFLIVVPQSTLMNWTRELKMWVPDMEVLSFYGEKPAREIIKDYALFQNSSSRSARDTRPLKCHVVLTTPDVIQLETKVFQEVGWEVLVVDEGHQRVKNSDSIQFEALMSLNVKHKVLLTGTPVQNNLREMFNLLHFLDKVSFPDPVKMAAEYGDGLNKDKLVDLHHLVRPYILRRIKSDVLQALPGKSETIVPVGLSTLQRSLYKQILLDNYDVLASGALKRKSAAARSQLISKVLAEIRRLVQHPYLLKDVEPKFPTREETHRRLVESSGKLYLLDKMLKKLIAGGHRTLIFSTMKLVLDILEDYLLGESINYCRLDGETSLKDRQDAIDRFNGRDDIPVFILTTRAGGLGINLTSADSVIIWDSDWNPHQDLQALARAHRIGQERHVGVWKFVTKGTAEERIFQIAKKKLILDHLVVQKLEEETLDEKDVEGVLRFGAEQLFAEEGENTNNEMTIVYDDAAVDKLLERTEDEKPQETTKKASSFSFARVWVTTSADTHAPQETHVEGGDEVPLELGETETDMQESEEMGDAFWQRLLEGRVNKTQAQSAKGKRTRKEVDYATPSKRKRRPKGADAGQDVEESDGDDGFSPLKSSDDEGEEEEGSGSEEGSMDNEDTPLRGDVTDLSMLDDYLRDADDPEVCVACRTKCGNSLENDADGCMIPFSERGDVIARLPEARDQLSSNVRLLTEMLIRRVTERDEIFRFHLKHGRNIYSSLEGLYPPAVDVLATPPGADAGPLDVAAQSDVITTDAQPVLP